jgi:hypothetical protein
MLVLVKQALLFAYRVAVSPMPKRRRPHNPRLVESPLASK